ncbi:hypothetical protein MalM25_01670 [Planctomycetes bacterium MalM25]|nr:hypothetical protein MalM25_01670 [Planctomycetes bacterium MalM25]
MSIVALLLAEGGETSPYASIVFAAGVLLLIFVLFRQNLLRFGKRTRGGDGPPIVKQRRPEHAWDGVKQDAEARFGQQQVEFHETAREMMGQLDSKMSLLRALIAQSDERIARLEALASGGGGMADRPGGPDGARAGEG